MPLQLCCNTIITGVGGLRLGVRENDSSSDPASDSVSDHGESCFVVPTAKTIGSGRAKIVSLELSEAY
jgi:hypothetical protein